MAAINGSNIIANLKKVTGEKNWSIEYDDGNGVVAYPQNGSYLKGTQIINEISVICNNTGITIPNPINFSSYNIGSIQVVNNNMNYTGKNAQGHGISNVYVFTAINEILHALATANNDPNLPSKFTFISH